MTEKIRYAVGALVCHDGKILLVRKVKMMDAENGPEEIAPMWDFPKGGVVSDDVDFSAAVLRELREEVGSTAFNVVATLPDFVFDFDPVTAGKIGADKQVTKMFKVRYMGDGTDLQPQDEEIDRVEFVTFAAALKRVTFANSRSYISQHVK